MRRIGNHIATWAWFTVLAFVLYDVIWALADTTWIKQGLPDGGMSLWIDLCYSALFSLFSIAASRFIIRRNLLKSVKRGRAMLFGLIMLALNISLATFIEEVIMDNFFEPIESSEALSNAYFMGLIASVLSLIFTADYYIETTARQQQENNRLHMQLLKMQLNPHFIFNSLSALAYLIGTNPKQAEKYTVYLAKIYRYILGHMDADTVPVKDCLAFSKDYMALLKLRYENINMNIRGFEYGSNECVLSLSLQVLIENAVKHNAPGPAKTLRIDIGREGDRLVVSNNILRSTATGRGPAEAHGIGLENLKKRYRMKFDRAIDIVETRDCFKVYIPIIKVNHEKGIDY